MKKIITYGTFDTFHFGHLELLRRAKEMGDYLVVAVSTDEFNKIKNKKSFFSYKERVNMLEAIKYVDEIIPEDNWEQKIGDIKNHDIDTFVIGNDWEGKFDFLKDYCDVEYLNRTKTVSSTLLKDLLK